MASSNRNSNTCDTQKPLWVSSLVLLLVLALLAASPAAQAADAERGDLGRHFAAYGVTGAFVLYDPGADTFTFYDRERCHQRFIPASTFKIVNALIALETGVAGDENHPIAWDGVKRGVSAWDRDHTLKSAFAASAVWYYQELARRIGPERMQHHLDKLAYGNGDIAGGIDRFWLTGGLRISPLEQIALLVRLHRGQLPFSARSQDIVKSIMIQRQGEGYTLRAKTGWAQLDQDIGWYVGYIEKGGDAYFFATCVTSAPGNKDFARSRQEITTLILRDLGIMLAEKQGRG
jgi:beta-lactamase class D